ncbi:N-acetyltransferase GCN5 [Fimicolochytrium jonesii]|uniref:N-acetyltransferase GCN5 n=1 Tax=Fimicolochytrium jonesii TaxID=1396493 RepID=UPI0022FE7562|nr:N-acetyltransferase GCN5 [Fimicolochytrium jonesii]KAI8826538.1 N-acetyltransferase GCN5 [Fimicolochytrium jonesii]
MSSIKIRPAAPTDVPLILSFIRSLALFEKALDKVLATEASLTATLFGAHPYAHVVFACDEQSGREMGMALYFFNYSTWNAAPGLYLEDLMVAEEDRGKGVGTELLRYLAGVAVEKGCGRMEWQALDWNTPAIEFYRKKVGAKSQDEWIGFRLDGEALTLFAKSS